MESSWPEWSTWGTPSNSAGRPQTTDATTSSTSNVLFPSNHPAIPNTLPTLSDLVARDSDVHHQQQQQHQQSLRNQTKTPELDNSFTQLLRSLSLATSPSCDLNLGIIGSGFNSNSDDSRSVLDTIANHHQHHLHFQQQPTYSSVVNPSPASSIGLPIVAPLNGHQQLQVEKFESHMRAIANDIHSTVQLHINGLLSRREHLLNQLDTIKNVYLPLFQGANGQRSNRSLGGSSPPDYHSLLDFESDVPLLPNVTFTKPDQALYKAITSMGFLTSPAFAPYCSMTGDGLESVIPGQNMSFIVFTKSCFNEDLMIGHEVITTRIYAVSDGQQASPTSRPDGDPFSLLNGSNNSSTGNHHQKMTCSTSIVDHNNGKYTVTYTLPQTRANLIHVEVTVLVNGLIMTGCPLKIPIRSHQKQTWKKVFAYGSEGKELGQFCRPWGVAITRMPPDFVVPPVNVSPTGELIDINDSHQQSYFGAPSPPSTGSPMNGANNLNSPLSSGSSPTTSGSSGHSTSSSSSSTLGTQYLIAVADRSNNRIQILKYDQAISPLFTFGSGPGTRPGQFDRPAGLCFNVNLGHIAVADKDNHRVQVFDMSGRFLFKFGEKGNRLGQFCYPWDIESCPKTGQLIVSDTRNRRVQVFTPYGQYLQHFAQPLDSPRGVAFLADGKVVVSDFNKHRLLIFDRTSTTQNGLPQPNNYHHHTLQHPPGHHHLPPPQHHSVGSSAPTTPTPPNMSTRFIGFGEGSGWGEFLRPQGVAFNGSYVFCSDSRNNRICLYNLNSQSFEYLTEDVTPQLDRPSGIAVLDHLMVVVDFGNNRLQVCTR